MAGVDDVYMLMARGEDDSPRLWIHRWEMSYPLSFPFVARKGESWRQWAAAINDGMEMLGDGDPGFVLVGHGLGANALAGWCYAAGVDKQRRVLGAVLVSPSKSNWPEDEAHPLNRARANFPAYVVTARRDPDSPLPWAKSLAANFGARHIEAPYELNMNDSLKGWQWGMRLVQHIILDR